MILELGEGREVRLPDSMEDETARQLKRLLLGGEERAAAAEKRSEELGAEVAGLRTRLDALLNQPRDTGAADAIRAMHNEMREHMTDLRKIMAADREMVADEYGEMRRSRMVK